MTDVTAQIEKKRTESDVLYQEKKILALEALSKLAAQFANDPNLQTLMDSAVLTVTGQFAVTSAMIVTKGTTLSAGVSIKAATGKFRSFPITDDFMHASLAFAELLADPKPIGIEVLTELVSDSSDSAIYAEWRDMGVQIVVPLIVNGTPIGLMLLGSRVGSLRFTTETIELLQHIIATITPLIANSFLYSDMAALSARHLQILDSVRQAIFVFDVRGQLVMANRAATDLTRSIVSIEGNAFEPGTPIELAFPDQLFPGWAERLRNILDGLSNRIPSTMTIKGKDGEKVFSVSICAGVGLSTSQEGMILTLDDKTEETNNERRMFELEKFAEQGVMASSISHELNNHLGMILGGVELAIVAQQRGNQEKVTSTLAKLRESITRMERFTAGLMDYARVNPQKQATQINDLVSDVISFAVAQKRFSGVTLKADLAPEIPVMQMDRDQIAQVIINILNNAADAISETDRRDGIIIVATYVEAGDLVLAISDNGRGMPQAVKEKLFKAHLTTKPKGHGYGLTTCAKILEHHDAKIRIESRIGFGTTFEFRFPLSENLSHD